MMTIEGKDYDDTCQVQAKFWVAFTENYVNLSQHIYPFDTNVWKTLDYVDCIKIFACFIILVGGLLGNVSIILTVALRKSMRTTINLYIANLAVADVMACTICTSCLAVTGMMDNDVYILGEFMCRTTTFVEILCLTSSVLTLALITYDRFVPIVFPLHVRARKQRPWLLITIVWIVSTAIGMPLILVTKHVTTEWKNFLKPSCHAIWATVWRYDKLLEDCVMHQPLATFYALLITVGVFFLPLLVMLIAYSFILWKVWTTEASGEQQEADLIADSRMRKKVNKMLFVVLLAFIICWLPYQVIILYAKFGIKVTGKDEYPEWFPTFKWFAAYMAFANSFVNPVIYGIFNRNFRKGLLTILPCVQLRNRRRNPNVTRPQQKPELQRNQESKKVRVKLPGS